MSREDQPYTKEQIARYFLELKSKWEGWVKGEESDLILEPETTDFFRWLGYLYFRRVMIAEGHEDFGFDEVDRNRAWDIVLSFLVTKRKRTEELWMDDMFARGLEKAAAAGVVTDEEVLTEVVPWLMKQFYFQVRNAVRQFVSQEKGGKGYRKGARSYESEVSTGSWALRERRKQLGKERVIAKDEGESLRKVGKVYAEAKFEPLNDSQKVGVWALWSRYKIGEIVNWNNPRILAHIDVKKSAFYEARKRVVLELKEAVEAGPEWEELDSLGQRFLVNAAINELLDCGNFWFLRKTGGSIS